MTKEAGHQTPPPPPLLPLLPQPPSLACNRLSWHGLVLLGPPLFPPSPCQALFLIRPFLPAPSLNPYAPCAVWLSAALSVPPTALSWSLTLAHCTPPVKSHPSPLPPTHQCMPPCHGSGLSTWAGLTHRSHIAPWAKADLPPVITYFPTFLAIKHALSVFFLPAFKHFLPTSF